jgi:hypothetical protein
MHDIGGNMNTIDMVIDKAHRDLTMARIFRQTGWSGKEYLESSGRLIDAGIEMCERIISRYEDEE